MSSAEHPACGSHVLIHKSRYTHAMPSAPELNTSKLWHQWMKPTRCKPPSDISKVRAKESWDSFFLLKLQASCHIGTVAEFSRGTAKHPKIPTPARPICLKALVHWARPSSVVVQRDVRACVKSDRTKEPLLHATCGKTWWDGCVLRCAPARPGTGKLCANAHSVT